jgi:Family of unknown function (DUF6491)
MRRFAILLVLALPACASAPPPPLDPVRANAFLDAGQFGALQSWQGLRDGSIVLQGADKKWQRATFTSPCAGLANASAVTLKVSKIGTIDKVQGVTPTTPAGAAETCYFNTLEAVDDPKSLAIAAPSAPVEGRALPAPAR